MLSTGCLLYTSADYFQTQAVFEPEKFIKFMEKAKQFGKPVQVGIIIPKSAGMAKFMNNNVDGIHVPDEMIEELKDVYKRQGRKDGSLWYGY